jgi:hypothetical protein
MRTFLLLFATMFVISNSTRLFMKEESNNDPTNKDTREDESREPSSDNDTSNKPVATNDSDKDDDTVYLEVPSDWEVPDGWVAAPDGGWIVPQGLITPEDDEDTKKKKNNTSEEADSNGT